jgi:GMP synthase (glutamine-hydrolysing)
MKKIIIIKTGKTFPNTLQQYGDFENWAIHQLNCSPENISVTDVTDPNTELETPDGSKVIIMGSHSMVTDNEIWIQKLMDWVPSLIDKKIPVLGICFGHQLIAHAMRGEAGYHPKGVEIGTVPISLNDAGKSDRLFCELPSTFFGHVTHYQSALQLPHESQLLASSSHEAHHAFRIGECCWGVQFHPEFTTDITHAYIDEQKETLLSNGFVINDIHKTVRETPEANSILQRFAKLK